MSSTQEAMPNVPTEFEGRQIVDCFGNTSVVGTFNPCEQEVKRVLIVEDGQPGTVRAWYGNRRRGTYAYVVAGRVLFQTTFIAHAESYENVPVPIDRFVLCSNKPTILWTPPGYYYGYRTLERNTKVIVMPTYILTGSEKTDVHTPWDTFGKAVWEIQSEEIGLVE